MNEGATMAKGNGEGPRHIYFSPWLDRATGQTYGPSPQTLARKVAQHRNWSFRVSTPSRVARSADAAELRLFMRLEDGTLRMGVPESEVRAYLLVVEGGYSERTAAVKLDCSRRTVRKAIERLKEKAGSES